MTKTIELTGDLEECRATVERHLDARIARALSDTEELLVEMQATREELEAELQLQRAELAEWRAGVLREVLAWVEHGGSVH